MCCWKKVCVTTERHRVFKHVAKKWIASRIYNRVAVTLGPHLVVVANSSAMTHLVPVYIFLFVITYHVSCDGLRTWREICKPVIVIFILWD